MTTDSNILFCADFVGAGYDIGDEPVSGFVNIAAGPAISKETGYTFSYINSPSAIILKVKDALLVGHALDF